jgi:hypothetical protein
MCQASAADELDLPSAKAAKVELSGGSKVRTLTQTQTQSEKCHTWTVGHACGGDIDEENTCGVHIYAELQRPSKNRLVGVT